MKTLALACCQRGNCSRWSTISGKRFQNINLKLKEDNNDKKKKNGRPKKSAVSRKSKIIGVCFSEPELYAIRHRAAKAKLPLSVYCHDAILDGVVKEPLKKEDIEVLRELSAIGNNLNQLTRTAKFMGNKQVENKATPILEYILNVINKLSDDWKSAKRKKL